MDIPEVVLRGDRYDVYFDVRLTAARTGWTGKRCRCHERQTAYTVTNCSYAASRAA